MKKKLVGLLAVLLSFAMIAAACGDDDSDSSSSSEASSSEASSSEAAVPFLRARCMVICFSLLFRGSCKAHARNDGSSER